MTASSLTPGPARTVADDPALGVNVFLGWWHEPDELEPLARHMREAGMRWLREPLAWALVEPEPGVYDWSRFELGFDVATALGFEVMVTVGTTPDWAASAPGRTMPRLDAWEAFCRTAVERYGDRVAAWEIGNEPNFPTFWLPEPDAAEYAAYLVAAHRGVKSADPDALTVAMSTSGADVPFIEAVFEAGGAAATEAIAVHPYTAAIGPEAGGQSEKLEALADLMRRWGLPPRIWLTELGWGTHPTDRKNAVSPEAQADYLVRGYTLARAVEGVERCFWFCARDFVQPNPEDWPPEWEYTRYYGLLDRDLGPKPALEACRIMTGELGGSAFVEHLSAPAGAHVLRFVGDGRDVAVCWAEEPTVLPLAGASSAVAVDGAEAPLGEADGLPAVRLSSSPIYVRFG